MLDVLGNNIDLCKLKNPSQSSGFNAILLKAINY